jgi:hypothetical protein
VECGGVDRRALERIDERIRGQRHAADRKP